jgi:predicted nucleic acid-binding protein
VASFSLDSNCMIAAVCGWHEHHAAAAAAIESRLQEGQTLVIAAHAIAEAYAVLTRLPPPHRLSPADAWTSIKCSFVEHAKIAVLPSNDYLAVLEALAAGGAGGGRTYDALIAAAALHGSASDFLTFNAAHFDPAPRGLRIVEPPPGPSPAKRKR